MFFVLSGYLITGVLQDDRAAPLGPYLRRFYWRCTLLNLASAALIAAAVAAHRVGGPVAARGWRPLAGLGKVSWGVYVLHWPLLLFRFHPLPADDHSRRPHVRGLDGTRRRRCLVELALLGVFVAMKERALRLLDSHS